jgi:hypothetical protein
MDGRTDELDRELREHLRARSAPAGFADRVMARIPAQRSPRTAWQFVAQPVWRWAAIAAVLAVTVLGGLEHNREQRIAGEHAREQVLLALRITGTTLREVQQKVQTPPQK